MGQVNNLNDGNFQRIVLDRLDRLERASPMNNAAIGRGGIEVYDGGVITISNGGLSVTGTATILGTLIASGVINFTGTVTISGPLTVSGLTTVTNNLVVASGGKITAGTIELNPDGSAKFGTMTISPAGKITTGGAEINPDGSAKFGATSIDTAGAVKVGTSMTLAPSTDGGAATFSNGAKLSSGSGAITMYGVGGTSTVTAAGTSAGLTSGSSSAVMFNDGTWKVGSSANLVDALTAGQVNVTAATSGKLAGGTGSVTVTSSTTTVSNNLNANAAITNAGMPTTTIAANMYASASNTFYKVTSAARFKVDPQPMDLPDSLLDVPVKDWWDKGEYDLGEAVRRVPGVIAEEVEAAGGAPFVTYDNEGTIQGIAYDRYALARTSVLGRKLDAALSKLEKAVARIQALEDAS